MAKKKETAFRFGRGLHKIIKPKQHFEYWTKDMCFRFNLKRDIDYKQYTANAISQCDFSQDAAQQIIDYYQSV